jgi:ribosomal protein L14E/L6E/L27E
MVGMMAVSKAGHDKLETFVIVKEDDKYVYLCDGRLKKLSNPKKKSKKHN